MSGNPNKSEFIRVYQNKSEFIRIWKNQNSSNAWRVCVFARVGRVFAPYGVFMAVCVEFTTWTGKRLYGPPGAFLDMISERRQTGNVKTVWISCLFAPYGVFAAVCGGIPPEPEKRLYGLSGALCAAISPPPLKPPLAAHCITYYLNCQMYFVKQFDTFYKSLFTHFCTAA